MSLGEWPELSNIRSEGRYELVLKGCTGRHPDVNDEAVQAAAFTENCLLNFISITSSKLSILYNYIGRCGSLTKLALTGNQLSTLPDVIGSLSSLVFLDVSCNEMTSMPASIEKLKKLEILNLSKNQLNHTSICDLSQLERLHVLDVSFNELDRIPFLGGLKHLHTMNFSNNHIIQIDESVGQMELTKDLNLASNQLIDIPGPIGRLSKLRVLDLSNNPFKDNRFKKLTNDNRAKVSAVVAYIAKAVPPSKPKKAESSSASPNLADKKESPVILHIGELEMAVDRLSSVAEIRPHLTCCLISNIDLTGENFRKFIAIQTSLHASLCNNRIAATIGTHDLAKVKLPLKYMALDKDEVHITALHKRTPISGRELLDSLVRDAEFARKRTKRSSLNPLHRYLHLVQDLPALPCLVDVEGLVISMAPLTQSDITKLSESTTKIFVEVSSSESLQVCRDVMDALITETRAFSPEIELHQVRVMCSEKGDLISVYPDKNDLSQLEIVRQSA